ncbi:hypothetical protein RJ639_002751 [Escallonia herrerae]|uniref:Uncharacterized protein n=1 Tax=Escallonia herrerae TaxID=1293975 RepID=A0AA88W1M7_9ASTE|nr:hypothetical protein RJ639_002751 [Escallonia herrerae]
MLLVGKDTITVDEVTTTLLETDSLKDLGGSSHADGLVARADPKSDSRRNKNWQRGKRNGKDKVRSQSRAQDDVICHYCKYEECSKLDAKSRQCTFLGYETGCGI